MASVQGRLLDQPFQDVLTPGTDLHKKWIAQVMAVISIKPYDDLKALAKGKPLALGEVGVPSTLEMLASQPDWTPG